MEIKKMKKLNLGLSNFNYLDNNKFIRYSKPALDVFFDRENEKKVINLILKSKFKQKTISIEDYGFDASNFFVSMPFLKNLKTIKDIKKLNKKKLLRIYKLIHAFHKINTEHFDIKLFNPRQKMIDYYSNCKKWVLPKEIKWSKIEKLINYIGEIKTTQKVLCHQDLTPGNIVSHKRKMMLIDFEYAEINDPIYDFASLISETLVPLKKEDLMFKILKKKEININILKLWIQYQNYLWFFWSFYLYKVTLDQKFKKIYEFKLSQIKLYNYNNC